MRRTLTRRLAPAAALALSAAVAGAVGLSPTAHADTATYTVTTLHFKVGTGPDGATECDVVGDLYLPNSASPSSPVPAILTTNGFGGSKDDQAGIGKAFAQRGYAVLSYSGLGFGGSTCKITLDDPDYDGIAGSQLVSYLGGAPGIAYTDAAHATAAPVLTSIIHDPTDHDGVAQTYDPRVGMVGGSYGGQIQFAIASVDHRVDTIVPIITWSDLTYSLGPNNTNQTTGVTTANSGATKLTWGLLLSFDGISQAAAHAQEDPSRLFPCVGFTSWVCPALVNAGGLGYFDAASLQHLRHASVASYLPKIKVPVYLLQGETDTLFNLNEAIANYQGLRAQGTPVKMIWQSWGHSGGPAPGEIDLANPDPAAQYETGLISNWFEHYLKGSSVGTGPQFAYYRDWVSYSGNASPAYATSGTFPVGTTKNYYLTSHQGLTTNLLGITRSNQLLTTVPAGAPAEFGSLDAIGSKFAPSPETDLLGTYADYITPTLTQKVDVVGSPRLTLKVTSPSAEATQGTGEAGQLVLFIRIQDVPPGSTYRGNDIRYLTAPVRVPDVSRPFTVTLPAFVHRFAPGHKIRLVIAGSSLNYRGGLVANPVAITTGSAGQVLKLPVVN
ncbi:MAG: CocE/NonD family hydrolase [Marmoricola sp.]